MPGPLPPDRRLRAVRRGRRSPSESRNRCMASAMRPGSSRGRWRLRSRGARRDVDKSQGRMREVQPCAQLTRARQYGRAPDSLGSPALAAVRPNHAVSVSLHHAGGATPDRGVVAAGSRSNVLVGPHTPVKCDECHKRKMPQIKRSVAGTELTLNAKWSSSPWSPWLAV